MPKMTETEVREKVLNLLRAVGNDTNQESDYVKSSRELIKALVLPLRQGIMPGNIFSGIFEVTKFENGISTEYPLDFLSPGTEKEYSAWTVPSQGNLPQKDVEGDFVMVPTYNVANSLTWCLRYARDARWDILRRAMQVLEAGLVKKMNDDCWHIILTAGVDRNIVVTDTDAAVGLFTKRLVSLMKTIMRRNGGGNSTSINRSKLTDLYLSPENMEDMRTWGVDQIDEITRREIYMAGDGMINRVFSVNLHDLDELGESQEYQNFFTNELGGSLAASDVELIVGLDLSKNDSFVMPVRGEVQMYEDTRLFFENRGGWMLRYEYGLGVLDSRRVLLGSC